jgi:hypothetical protein
MKKENIVSEYMKAIGNEKLSSRAWKRLSKLNAKILGNLHMCICKGRKGYACSSCNIK